jgi:hypothetical protein
MPLYQILTISPSNYNDSTSTLANSTKTTSSTDDIPSGVLSIIVTFGISMWCCSTVTIAFTMYKYVQLLPSTGVSNQIWFIRSPPIIATIHIISITFYFIFSFLFYYFTALIPTNETSLFVLSFFDFWLYYSPQILSLVYYAHRYSIIHYADISRSRQAFDWFWVRFSFKTVSLFIPFLFMIRLFNFCWYCMC